MQMSMAKKIYLIMGVLVLVAAFVLGMGVYSLRVLHREINRIGRQSDRAIAMLNLDRVVVDLQQAASSLVASDDEREMTRLGEEFLNLRARADTLMQTYTGNLVATSDPFELAVESKFRQVWEPYVAICQQVVELGKANTNNQARAIDKNLQPFWNAIDKELNDLADSLIGAKNPAANRFRPIIRGQRATLAFFRLGMTRYFEAHETADSEAIEKELRSYMKEIDDTLAAAAREIPADLGGAWAADIGKKLKETGATAFEQMAELMAVNSLGKAEVLLAGDADATFRQVDNVTEETIAFVMRRQDEVIEESQHVVARTEAFMYTVSLAGIVAAMAVALLVMSRINRQLVRIIDGLGESSRQVHSAADQISDAAQNLAEGATEQAASLEETSAALEQMSSMTRQNADNAGKTNDITVANTAMIANGAEAVTNMSGAMAEINDSAEQISRIIKTIEEIAFNTNLLALNAAVEAARAGEAGKGFAVVADEVRNLAGRSSQAAKDTTHLIETTIARVKHGSAIAQQLDADFSGIESGSVNVGKLVEEIANASSEQATGVDQVNTAVAQMDKVTQQNAAAAEESASASEQLSAQASQLHETVEELTMLVEGSKRKHGWLAGMKEKREARRMRRRSARDAVQSLHLPAAARKRARQAKLLPGPAEVVPLSVGDDF